MARSRWSLVEAAVGPPSSEGTSLLTPPGINLAFVKLALNSGAKVLICDLKSTTEATELIKSSNGSVGFMKCDVSKWSDLEAIPSEVEKAFGKGSVADVWIAGAGIFEPKWSSFLYDEEKDHYMQMTINAEHPIKLTRIAMRSCLGANKPCVCLLVASGAGINGIYASALYCATKHAVGKLIKNLIVFARQNPRNNVPCRLTYWCAV